MTKAARYQCNLVPGRVLTTGPDPLSLAGAGKAMAGNQSPRLKYQCTIPILATFFSAQKQIKWWVAC